VRYDSCIHCRDRIQCPLPSQYSDHTPSWAFNLYIRPQTNHGCPIWRRGTSSTVKHQWNDVWDEFQPGECIR
jgi:hypothetical protein